MKNGIEINWYVVQAKTARERFAAASVTKLGLDVLLPELKHERPDRHRLRTAIKPLFPGYFFARFSPAASLDQVRYAPGVVRVISSGLWPIPLDEQIVAGIRARIERNGYVRLARRPLRMGECVTIRDGVFAGMVGRLVGECDDQARVTILLEAIDHARLIIERSLLTPSE